MEQVPGTVAGARDAAEAGPVALQGQGRCGGRIRDVACDATPPRNSETPDVNIIYIYIYIYIHYNIYIYT